MYIPRVTYVCLLTMHYLMLSVLCFMCLQHLCTSCKGGQAIFKKKTAMGTRELRKDSEACSQTIEIPPGPRAGQTGAEDVVLRHSRDLKGGGEEASCNQRGVDVDGPDLSAALETEGGTLAATPRPEAGSGRKNKCTRCCLFYSPPSQP